MNRPISDLPDLDAIGQWALTHWRDAPLITITRNQGGERQAFVPPDAAQRDGVPYTFEFGYVLALYQAAHTDAVLQRQDPNHQHWFDRFDATTRIPMCACGAVKRG